MPRWYKKYRFKVHAIKARLSSHCMPRPGSSCTLHNIKKHSTAFPKRPEYANIYRASHISSHVVHVFVYILVRISN